MTGSFQTRKPTSMSSFTLRYPPINFALLLLLLPSLVIVFIYYQTHLLTQQSLQDHLSQRMDATVSGQLLEEAIQYSGQKLAMDLDIDLKKIDISLDDYRELVREATEKFGRCQQYRLIVLQPGRYPCFSCSSRMEVLLAPKQTFKIGQTCGNEKSRYGTSLPEPGLKYYREFEGNAFEVLVAEYIQLKLYQHSQERQLVLKANQLSDTEMLLPPGNKITR